MKTKRFLGVLISMTMLFSMLNLTTFAADGEITLLASVPTGESAELVLQGTNTFADLKAEMEEKLKISFTDEGYGVYCSDAGIYYDHNQPDDTKTLTELGFESGDKLYAEKTMWDDTTETPIELFGLTITGGKGCCEPFGSYTEADFYWNYYYKTIYIKTDAPIKISGQGEKNANIIVNSGSKYTNLTISDLSLECSDGACIWINGSSWMKLTIEGKNSLLSTGEDAQYTKDKTPAIAMNDNTAYTYLIINPSTGSLNATTYCEGMPAIGTCSDSADTWGLRIEGGDITANGGPGAPGIRVDDLRIQGGNITSNGGKGSTEGIYAYVNTANAHLFKPPVQLIGGTIKTNIVRTNKTDSATGIVVLDEGSEIDEIISSNVYCNVNNDTTVTDGTKYYKINSSIDTEKANVEFLAGTTTLLSKTYAKTGDVVTLAVTSADGYEISDVKINGNSAEEVDGDYEFTMPDELAEITVVFAGDTEESYEWNIEYNSAGHQAVVTAKETGEYTVIFADYEDGKLNKIDCVPVTLDLGENTISQEDTSITLSTYDKVMIWNNMTELVPACPALIIE